MEGELLAVAHDTVAGVAPALIAHDVIRTGSELVDDLALALVAPLGADNRHHAHEVAFFPRRPSWSVVIRLDPS